MNLATENQTSVRVTTLHLLASPVVAKATIPGTISDYGSPPDHPTYKKNIHLNAKIILFQILKTMELRCETKIWYY